MSDILKKSDVESLTLGEIHPLGWRRRRLVLLDQTRLPGTVSYVRPGDFQAVVAAIRQLVVRGAPLIGVAAAYGLTQEAYRQPDRRHLLGAAQALKAARPTAVNLSWAIARLERIIRDRRVSGKGLALLLELEARAIEAEEIERSVRLGRYGATLIRSGDRIMTICNAGRLAAPGLGTALAAIYTARNQGKAVEVFVPETRPLLQGARLTAFELSRAGIRCTVLTDSMVATVMPQIDLILVGADRIARNGDTANKIGTYQMALIAEHFRKRFYVAAPSSTFDVSVATGKEIPIEYRDPQELTFWRGTQAAPAQVRFHNPAFDVTPHGLIAGIITDQGILKPPYRHAIRRLFVGSNQP
jgi:methylthioribose-1-phosphate isomerase